MDPNGAFGPSVYVIKMDFTYRKDSYVNFTYVKYIIIFTSVNEFILMPKKKKRKKGFIQWF